MRGLRKRAREIPLHLMMLPSVVLTIIFAYIPMAGVVIAFQKYNPAKGFIFTQKWAGLDNFIFMFQQPNIWQVTWNTLSIACMKIVFGLVVPLTVALMLNELRNVRLKRMIQTAIYFPHFLSWVILSGVIYDLLNPTGGAVNRLIQALGGNAIPFLSSNKWFPMTMVITDTWKGFGFGTIVYLASIAGIDPSLYEAAEIDGASRWKQTLYVTLPSMHMIIVLMMVMSLGNVLNAGFEQIFNLYSIMVYESGDIIDTLVYRLGLQQAKYGPSAAVGLLKSGVSCLLISLSYYISIKFFDYRLF